MKLEQILEAPFTDKQEERFLTALRQDTESDDGFPSPTKMTRMVKTASPKAKKIGDAVAELAAIANRNVKTGEPAHVRFWSSMTKRLKAAADSCKSIGY